MKGINIFQADDLLNSDVTHKANPLTSMVTVDGAWHVGRPIGNYTPMHRFKCAWRVFLGKADVIEFYKQ